MSKIIDQLSIIKNNYRNFDLNNRNRTSSKSICQDNYIINNIKIHYFKI